MPADPKLSGLSRKLVLDGLLEEKVVLDAQLASVKEKVSFSHYLVEKKLIPAKKIAMAAASEFGLPLLDLDAIELESIPRDLVDEKLIKKHQAIPLYKTR